MQREVVQYQQFVELEAPMLQKVMDFKESIETSEGFVSALSFDESLNYHPNLRSYTVCLVHDRIVGVATIFAPQSSEGEIAVCVAPEYRRMGIGRALVATMLEELGLHGVGKAILICDVKSSSGQAFIKALGANEVFHEYAMQLGMLVASEGGNGLSIRVATSEDVTVMAHICAAAYHEEFAASLAFVDACMIAVQRTGYVGEITGDIVAMCFVSDHPDAISINTVAVDPQFQQKGIGATFLSRILEACITKGKVITLDVNSSNVKALSLYKKLGFYVTSDIGYYEVVTSQSRCC